MCKSGLADDAPSSSFPSIVERLKFASLMIGIGDKYCLIGYDA